jgi:hypothetical protein
VFAETRATDVDEPADVELEPDVDAAVVGAVVGAVVTTGDAVEPLPEEHAAARMSAPTDRPTGRRRAMKIS